MVTDLITGNKDYVVEWVYVYDRDLKRGRWHRSRERKHTFPFGSYMMNKKWTMDEEFNNHMLRFQQVNMSFLNKIINSLTI